MRPVFKEGALTYAFCKRSNIRLRINLYSLYMLCSRVWVHSASKRYIIVASEKKKKNHFLLKVDASIRTILVTFFLRVILRFIFQFETFLRTIYSENCGQIENSPQNSLQI